VLPMSPVYRVTYVGGHSNALCERAGIRRKTG
jgi:hypothetical protein